MKSEKVATFQELIPIRVLNLKSYQKIIMNASLRIFVIKNWA